MIGKQQIEIMNAEMLLKGMSTSDHVSDGGFSPDSQGVNLLAYPGVLYFPDAVTDIDTDNRLSSAENIIASCPDNVAFNGEEREMVSNTGEYYEYDGTKIGAVLRTDGANTYTRGFTTMVNFKGEIRITTRETIVRWDEANAIFNASLVDISAITTLSGLADVFPHPQIVFEDFHFFASGNELFRAENITDSPTSPILKLSSENIITALGVDPDSGKMLIATTTSMNASDQLPATNKVMWYDGQSNKTLKEIEVQEKIFAFHHHGGVVFVGYGRNLGYLTGAGIQFARRLNNVTFSSGLLPYPPSFASVGHTLYVVDGPNILAYGPVLGQNIFYYCYENQVTPKTNELVHIFPTGQDTLGISSLSSTVGELRRLPLYTVASVDDSVFVTNWYRFPRPILPKTLLVEFADTITIANNSVFYQAETDSSHTANELSEQVSGTLYVHNMMGFLNERVSALKFQFGQGSGNNKGIRRAVLYFDYAE